MKRSLELALFGIGIGLACAVGMACSASHNTASPQGAAGDGAAGTSTGAAGSGAGGTVTSNGGTGGTGGILTVGPGGAAGGDGCSDETKGSIYILGESKEFARFEPQTQTLTVLGNLQCPGEDFNTTFSMAVDRNGVAWVLFAGGALYHVDTKTIACTPTSFTTCQTNFCQFGMGFVADAPDSEEETLYVSGVYNGPPGQGLATIDTTTLVLTPIADYDLLPGQGAELTGTGDARLFGYFQDNPIHLAEIDKATAKILTSADLIQIPGGLSWAFAFWGGSFYVMSGTGIYKYEPMSTITTLINGNVGFNIVGAGVSTCAPIEEPE